jgi:hypothetical protein
MPKITRITKDQMFNDLRRVLHHTFDQFQTRLLWGAGELALVGLGTHQVLYRFRDETKINTLDVEAMEVGRLLGQMYDYGVEGRLDKQLEDDLINVAEEIIPFFSEMSTSEFIEANVVLEDYPIATIMEILQVFEARLSLDFYNPLTGEHMQLKNVAILAGIDEKTAPNLAHPNAKNRLVTENIEGRAMVRKEFARKWLIGRGFNDTVTFDSTLDRNIADRGFWSLQDLGDYVLGRRERDGLDPKGIATATQGLVDSQWLAEIEAGRVVFDRVRLAALADALNVDQNAFVLAVFDRLRATERSALETELSAASI